MRSMWATIKYWYQRYLTDPQAGILFFTLLITGLLIGIFSKMLAPVFISIVLAYLLDWAVNGLKRCKIRHTIAVIIIFTIFLALVILFILDIGPLLAKQLSTFITVVPTWSAQLQTMLTQHIHKLPYISAEKMQGIVNDLQQEFVNFGQHMLTYSLSSIPSIITFVVYFIMVPLLVYFFLMDKQTILHWCGRFIPRQQTVLTQVWSELDIQIGNYVRGKVVEAVIIAIISYIVFIVLKLDYAALLAVLVGLSVFIPYVGAIMVTIPIVVIGFAQWGLGPHYFYLLLAYAAIITFDGTLLVTLLFSGAVSLHPIVIITAVLVFGGLLGFWGIFFAIPLASLCKAVIVHWPRAEINKK